MFFVYTHQRFFSTYGIMYIFSYHLEPNHVRSSVFFYCIFSFDVLRKASGTINTNYKSLRPLHTSRKFVKQIENSWTKRRIQHTRFALKQNRTIIVRFEMIFTFKKLEINRSLIGSLIRYLKIYVHVNGWRFVFFLRFLIKVHPVTYNYSKLLLTKPRTILNHKNKYYFCIR